MSGSRHGRNISFQDLFARPPLQPQRINTASLAATSVVATISACNTGAMTSERQRAVRNESSVVVTATAAASTAYARTSATPQFAVMPECAVSLPPPTPSSASSPSNNETEKASLGFILGGLRDGAQQHSNNERLHSHATPLKQLMQHHQLQRHQMGQQQHEFVPIKREPTELLHIGDYRDYRGNHNVCSNGHRHEVRHSIPGIGHGRRSYSSSNGSNGSNDGGGDSSDSYERSYVMREMTRLPSIVADTSASSPQQQQVHSLSNHQYDDYHLQYAQQQFKTSADLVPSSIPAVDAAGGNGRKKKRKARICKETDCDKYVVDHGLCIRHGGGKRCNVDGCNCRAQNRGLCWKHGGYTICKIDGCTKRAKSRGICWSHGGGTRCKSDGCSKIAVSLGRCWAHGGGKRCSIDGCMKPASERTSNLCADHFGWFQQGSADAFDERGQIDGAA